MSKIMDRILGNVNNTREPEVKYSLDQILDMKLSEFEKQNFSIELYSEVLNRTVWFCPDKEAAAQIKREDPEAVTYTPDELRHLIALNPGPESLKAIHEGKAALPGSLIGHKGWNNVG
ncbi:MAG: hypothetical protein ACRENF_01565 [Thermodesulfobacteriota bacterium]